MKTEVLWDDVLWWVVNTDILGDVLPVHSASCDFWVFNTHEDCIFPLIVNRQCIRPSRYLFFDGQNKMLPKPSFTGFNSGTCTALAHHQ